MTSAEVAAISRNSQLLCEAVSNVAGVIWFAQKLVDNDFITHQASSSIVATLGHSDMEKCYRLLNAVETQVSVNAALFHTLVDILRSQAALINYADAITKSYGRLSSHTYLQFTCT